MEVDSFGDSLDALDAQLGRKKTRQVNTEEEKNIVRAFVGAWFRSYRPIFVALLKTEESLLTMDAFFQELLTLATGPNDRTKYQATIRRAKKLFKNNFVVPLTKAYWERPLEPSFSDFNAEVARRLEIMEPFLRDSYETVIADLTSENRKSFKGTANELRELLREVLHRLAPDEKVTREQWFKDAHRGQTLISRPTHAERTRHILRERSKGSAAIESAESYTEAIEDRLGQVVRRSYTRASAAVHTHRARTEIQTQLRYINALLLELLPE